MLIKIGEMDTRKYLARINYEGNLQPSVDVLRSLQCAHLMKVPFENLDIHNKVKIDLANSYHKIVNKERGGFCYELNGLFYELLNELGFIVKMVSARAYSEKGYGAEFDHMAIIAGMDNAQYLVDVGFGEFALYPLKIELGVGQDDPRGIFKIEQYDYEYKIVLKKDGTGKFIPEYIFTEKERELREFYGMCHYHQTSSESHFTQKRVCSLPTKEGRITLKGSTLKITANDIVTERELNDEAEVSQVLWDYFKLKL